MTEIKERLAIYARAAMPNWPDDICSQSVNRIEWLEREVRRHAADAVAANTRIEALEAALRAVIRDFEDEPHASIASARAAIAPETDK